jgi:hypothetical protein
VGAAANRQLVRGDAVSAEPDGVCCVARPSHLLCTLTLLGTWCTGCCPMS